LTILIRFTQLADTDGSHTDYAATSKSEKGSKDIEENYVIADWEPEGECYDQ
jgi:hypothetical protein